MKLIVCIDERFGMAFNRRRQSKDSVLRADLLQITAGSRLWMDTYSASQFSVLPDHVCVHDQFLSLADVNDYCFVENTDIAPYAASVTGVIVYHWNRTYPADLKFPVTLFSARWKLESVMEFAGSSHELITREVYAL